MKNKLLLLRHGKSDWSSDHDDRHRTIKDRGKRYAQRIGTWLAEQNIIPDKVLSSPAQRAKVTAQKMLKAMGQKEQTICYDERIYQSSIGDLLELIAETKNSKILMLVGHNPSLESLLCFLADSNINRLSKHKLFPTAALAIFELTLPWEQIRQGCAEMKHLIYPRSLPKTFPYPLTSAKEQRIRPAYYYSQSSLIPYRYNKGELQILLISSSKNKHLVIPKGIVEPGLTAKQSAIKEAYEEAGVKGVVAEDTVGSYVYEKWDAQCQVIVYAMKVSQLIEENLWEEKHRGRQWMSINDAANAIYQKALKPIILSLEDYLV